MLLIANVKTIIYTAWKAAVFNSGFKKKKKVSDPSTWLVFKIKKLHDFWK